MAEGVVWSREMPEMRECELVGRESEDVEDVEEDPNAEASRAAGKAIHTEGCSSCMGRNVQRALVWNGARQRSGGANPVVAEPPPSHPPLTQLSGVDLAELGDMLDRAARIAAWRMSPARRRSCADLRLPQWREALPMFFSVLLIPYWAIGYPLLGALAKKS